MGPATEGADGLEPVRGGSVAAGVQKRRGEGKWKRQRGAENERQTRGRGKERTLNVNVHFDFSHFIVRSRQLHPKR